MPHIASVSWKKFEKFAIYVGCIFERQKGDHLVYNRNDLKRPVVFPKDKSIPVFIIRNNLRVLGISAEEYLEILRKV